MKAKLVSAEQFNQAVDAAQAPGKPSDFIQHRIRNAREVQAASHDHDTMRAYLRANGSTYADTTDPTMMVSAFLGWTLATLAELVHAVEDEAQVNG